MLTYIADSNRPDLAFIATMLGSASHAPQTQHRMKLRQVACYLRATRQTGLKYTNNDGTMWGQSNTDRAGCTETRGSTRGLLIYYGKFVIAWQSKVIRTVVKSTFAAEYIAASRAAEGLVRIRRIQQQLVWKPLRPTVLQFYNTAAITAASCRSKTNRSKYIDVHYHAIRDKISKGIIPLQHERSAGLSPDALTKPLRKIKIQRHRDAMRVTYWSTANMPTAVGVSEIVHVGE